MNKTAILGLEKYFASVEEAKLYIKNMKNDIQRWIETFPEPQYIESFLKDYIKIFNIEDRDEDGYRIQIEVTSQMYQEYLKYMFQHLEQELR